MSIRKCKVCNVILNSENTYKRPAALLCKKHYNEYNLQRLRKNGYKAMKEYDSKRNKTPERKKQFRETAKKMSLKYPEKQRARLLTAYAVRIGTLIKKPCIICGELKVEAHHEDYTKPMEIIWFCRKHHSIHHYPNSVNN